MNKDSDKISYSTNLRYLARGLPQSFRNKSLICPKDPGLVYVRTYLSKNRDTLKYFSSLTIFPTDDINVYASFRKLAHAIYRDLL